MGLFFNALIFAAAGDVDPNFIAGDGRVVTQFGNFSDVGRKVLIQPDGKIVVAGKGTAINSFGEFSVVRYNADGSLDTSFDGDGKVTTTIGTQDSTLYDAALQPDGKIVVVGVARSVSTNNDFAVVRYNSDGSLDGTFGNGGKVLTPIVADAGEAATAIVIQPDGKLVVAGNAGGFTAVRYNIDGSLDATFGTGGKVTTPISQNGSSANAVLLQSDGKIIVAGSLTVPIPQNSTSQMILVRYNSDGTLDTSFDGDGKAQTDFAYYAFCTDAVLQPDGKIVAVGKAILNAGDRNNFVAVRFNSNGSLDTGFGFGGKVLTPISNGDDTANSVVLQPDGRIVLTGGSKFSLVRYTADGSLDLTFGSGGKAITSVAAEDSANTIALQPDGKIVVAGSAAGIAASSKIAVIRYSPNGLIDRNFGFKLSGRVTTVVGGVIDESHAVVIQPDGKIVSAGRSRVGNRYNFSLIRHNPNGTLDSTFGTDGTQITKIGMGDTSSEIRAVALQSDGKIVVAGQFYDANNVNLSLYYFAVARYNSNGMLDTSFDGDGIKVLQTQFESNDAYDVAVQPDGKIVVAGNNDTLEGPQSSYDFGIVRLNSDGSPDSTFDGDGVVTTDLGSGIDTAYSIVLQPDGKILAGGSGGNSNLTFALVRYNSNGSLDSTFGSNGITLTAVGNSISEARSITLQTDGKIVAGGFARIGTQNDFAVVRYNSNGTLDTAFGNNGKVSTPISSNSNDSISALVIQSDGKIVAVGTTILASNSNLALTRYTQNGFLDVSFDGDGIVTTDYLSYGNTGETATAAALQTDGKLIVVGSLRNNLVLGIANDRRDYLTVRYLLNVKSAFDFDSDGKADISVFRPDNGAWYINQSMNGFTGIAFGQAGDRIVPADYDGDGKTDVAVYRNGTWYLNRSLAGFTAIGFGTADDIPQPSDFDGDGRAELAVFRPSNGTWYVLNLVTNQFSFVQFGQTGDKPVVADYDGDGRADYAVYRNGGWYILRSSQGSIGIQFGEAADRPVPADYDGDGKADVAVFRPSNGTWYLNRSAAGFAGVQFGITTDVPAPADYDGDGKADLAVFRDGAWYLQRSTAGFTGVAFGAANDRPVPNAFVP